MREVNAQRQAAIVTLRAAYQAAWCHYLAQVGRWQSVQAQPQLNRTTLREAETAVDVAEEQYRHARNTLADSMLERARARTESRDELRCFARPYRTRQSVCFDHA
jgi:hypothetical protein